MVLTLWGVGERSSILPFLELTDGKYSINTYIRHICISLLLSWIYNSNYTPIIYLRWLILTVHANMFHLVFTVNIRRVQWQCDRLSIWLIVHLHMAQGSEQWFHDSSFYWDHFRVAIWNMGCTWPLGDISWSECNNQATATCQHLVEMCMSHVS